MLNFSCTKSHIKNLSAQQDYAKLKAQHNGAKLFVDTEFPASNSSVYRTTEFKKWLIRKKRITPCGQVLWKRASEIAASAVPNFSLAKSKRLLLTYMPARLKAKRPSFGRASDLSQGYVGNCWFIAAVTGIVENRSLFAKVVPVDNSFLDQKEYCGWFRIVGSENMYTLYSIYYFL